MQIVELPRVWMILSFFVGWLVFQLGAAFIGNRLPDRWLQGGRLFDALGFESDSFYKKVFKVHVWKKLLPDGAAVSRKGFRKKNLQTADPAYIRQFILESKRAEIVHWAAIFPFWVFGLWSPPVVIPLMLAYALAVNGPCIIAQRYNRPRLQKLLGLLQTNRPKAS